MKLTEVKRQQVAAIFCDLDGVLVDFAKKAREVAGVVPDDQPENKSVRNAFWKAIGHHVAKGEKFFSVMDKMSDADQLWKHITGLDVPVRICSATGHIKGAKDEKRTWVETHLGDDVADSAIFVRKGEDKADYATPTSLLIDDRKKVIDAWTAAGGIGILHTDAASTIEKLKEYHYGV